jgi:outer membrane protein TolC
LIQVNSRVSENDELFSVGPRYRRTFRNAVSVDINPSFDYVRNTERGFDRSPGNQDGQRDDGFPRLSTSINVPLNSRPRLQIDTAIENAELDVVRSDYDLFIREQSVREQVINTYWNIQQVKESLDITRERLLQAKQIEFILQVQYENEKEALVNVNQAAVDVLTNEANFIQQEGNYRSTVEQFNILLGTPIETNLQLSDELVVEPLPMSSDKYIEMITSTNLEIKDLNIAIQQVENNLRITKLGQQPDVTFSTSFFRDDEGRQDISFGLFFTWAVFDGGSTKARVRALQESLAQQEINLSELERQLVQEAYDDLRELQLQDQRIEILDRNVDQSRITLDNALIQFREFGRITFRNMQDFQIDLANSRNSLLQAKVLYNRARSGLLQKVHDYKPSDRIAPLLEILR